MMYFTIILLATFSVFTSQNKNIENNYKPSVHSITITSITGEKIPLSKFKGKKILFVNTASECGFTKQYEDLEKLHRQYQNKLVVIGLPCNQFGNQEPGTLAEIQNFCKKNYGVTFLLTEKIDVKGINQHKLYSWLTKKVNNGVKNSTVKWNFQKYLVNENGEFIDFFYSLTNPMSAKIVNKL